MSPEGNLVRVVFGMVLGEVGFVFTYVPLTIAGSESAGGSERGLSAGLLNTSMQLGNVWSLGMAATVAAAVTAALGGLAAEGGALVGGLRWGFLLCAGFAVVALPIVLFGLPKGAPSGERGTGGGTGTSPSEDADGGRN